MIASPHSTDTAYYWCNLTSITLVFGGDEPGLSDRTLHHKPRLWLGIRESNSYQQSQSLLRYRYANPQYYGRQGGTRTLKTTLLRRICMPVPSLAYLVSVCPDSQASFRFAIEMENETRWYSRWDSNPHYKVFKTFASSYWATRAYVGLYLPVIHFLLYTMLLIL